MPATIVVGGQYGSEGKGKVTALLASRLNSPWLVRCGGPNFCHTVPIDGADVILRQVPCCAEPHKATFCLAAGCVIDETVLLNELDLLKIDRNRIVIDPRAVIVTEQDREAERNELRHIASTCSGNGAALVRRMSRRGEVPLVKDSSMLRGRCRIETVAPLIILLSHREIQQQPVLRWKWGCLPASSTKSLWSYARSQLGWADQAAPWRTRFRGKRLAGFLAHLQ